MSRDHMTCEHCDCADPTAQPGLAAECDCKCHRRCRRCKANMSGETLNHRTICFDCQRRTLREKYKRIYQRRLRRKQS